MRVPRSWLRELVDVDVPTEELADRLSMTGSAVDKIERFAKGVSGIVVGSVVEVGDVPGSDKLCVAQVDAGVKGRVQIVAGAKNFRAGDKVPVALPGARVTTLMSPVGVRTMVGYESRGMLCSARELGISDEHAGIAVLDSDVSTGGDVAELLGLDDDVLAFEIYPNRPDLMSVIGIAREVALLYSAKLRIPDASVVEDGPPVVELTSVEVSDGTGCPRYLARVIEDVTFGPSPLLVQARLTACGFRPLGNLVDATNYALLLCGQPMHAFDLDTLAEERIIVRRARSGELLATLDNAEHALDPDDLVIADAKSAQGLAGVMGGAASEVGESTRRVLLESAHFDARSIARTAQRHRMRTEASSRFERGSDPEAVTTAAAIAAELIRRWAGGRVALGVLDEGGAPARRKLLLRPERIRAVLGIDVSAAEQDRFLAGIGCDVSRTKKGVDVEVPSWRPDLEREIDLVEEIARLHGYENIAPQHRSGVHGRRTAVQVLRNRVRDVLLGAGMYEATLSTFVASEDLDAIGYDGPLVRPSNPMTEDQRQLRPLLLPGLLRAAERNVARGVERVRLFEIGKVFGEWSVDSELPDEREHLGLVLAGGADVLDLKGLIELVLSELGVEGFELAPVEGMPFHPGKSASIVADGSRVGRFGQIRPSVARSFDLEGGVVLGGLALTALFADAPERRTVRPLPTQPPVLRDITMALPEDVAAGDVGHTITSAGGELLETVALVDVYRGSQIGEGKRSLTYRLTFRAADRTLTAAEVDALREAIAVSCRDRHGAIIR